MTSDSTFQIFSSASMGEQEHCNIVGPCVRESVAIRNFGSWHWAVGGQKYQMTFPSNSGAEWRAQGDTSLLGSVLGDDVWDANLGSMRLERMRKGFVLKSGNGPQATYRVSPIRRISCRFSHNMPGHIPCFVFLGLYLKSEVGG